MAKPLTGIYLKCLNCYKECYTPKNRISKFKFCCRSCAALFVRVKIKKECEICRKIFEHISARSNKAKYCSRQCYYKARINKGNIEYKCQHCGILFKDSLSHKRKFCSKSCVGKSSVSTFNPSYTTVRKAMLNRKLINKCERCGFNKEPKILGVHHKDRNRNNNELINLEILCPNCHSLEHSKHICHGFRE